MNTKEVREWVHFACECCGCPELAWRIEIQWSKRMTRAMGYAQYKFGGMYTVKFSVPIFDSATSEERYQTIVHETAHCIDHYQNKRPMSHGATWKQTMRKCGVEPLVYHSVNLAGLRKRHIYRCPQCGKRFNISNRMHHGILRGKYRVCNSCKVRIVYVEREG